MLALDTLAALAPRAEREIGASLPSIVPRVGECLFDTKKEVKKAATLAVTAACAAIANPDIAPCVPKLIDALALPAHTEQALDAMLQTTFVARVDAPTLAIAVPALARGLRDRMDPEPRRKAATIIAVSPPRVFASVDALRLSSVPTIASWPCLAARRSSVSESSA